MDIWISIPNIWIFYKTCWGHTLMFYPIGLFSHSIVSDSLHSHRLQHARLPCPSPLLEFAQTHVHWVGDAIQPFHPLSSPSPPAFNPSQHQVISNELVFRIRWPKYWRFSFSISPSNEYLGLISFRIDLISLQSKGLKSLLQHNSKTSIIGYTPIQNKV